MYIEFDFKTPLRIYIKHPPAPRHACLLYRGIAFAFAPCVCVFAAQAKVETPRSEQEEVITESKNSNQGSNCRPNASFVQV